VKLRITFKTPNAVDNAILDATDDIVAQADLDDLCSNWISYGESVTLEVDTEAKTCIVLPVH
jgi:hypothetical protein